MGAIADILIMGDWTRLRMWALALAVAIAGTTWLQFAGLIDVHNAIYTGSRLPWLSHLTGGLLFGIGMTLASGCGAKKTWCGSAAATSSPWWSSSSSACRPT
jgi:uncharacterized membrane protein YedE/YeeE